MLPGNYPAQYRFKHRRWAVVQGDCIDVMRKMRANSVDSIVSDAPYGIAFMSKHWDKHVSPQRFQQWCEEWAIECLRVLKPGGHALIFGGSRMYHRMACGVEDASFEVRDMMLYLYGSSMPHGLNIANAIHDVAIGQPQGGDKPASKNHGKYKSGCSADNPSGRGFGAGVGKYMAVMGEREDRNLVVCAEWKGWNTALKPAHEPILLARKPLEGTVVNNVLKHGTGGLNIDGCRIGVSKDVPASASRARGNALQGSVDGSLRKLTGNEDCFNPNIGRWPANICHDGSEEVLHYFPNGKSGKPGVRRKDHATNSMSGTLACTGETEVGYGDAGSAARFFYTSKVSSRERNQSGDNNHPTVKPVNLMAYLCRLITPPGGIVLDPFTGSGSTGIGARLEGFRFFGIEREEEYVNIARKRINDFKSYRK